jgi:hypothetical protein
MERRDAMKSKGHANTTGAARGGSLRASLQEAQEFAAAGVSAYIARSRGDSVKAAQRKDERTGAERRIAGRR